jgi:hypothetical protein
VRAPGPRVSGRRALGHQLARRIAAHELERGSLLQRLLECQLDHILRDGPGINVRAAQWLVEGHGAMLVGADQATVEY